MKRTASLAVSLGTLILILIAAGFVYLGVKATQKVGEMRREQETQKIESAAPNDKTIGWPTWRSDDHGIAFRYPEGWQIAGADELFEIFAPDGEAETYKAVLEIKSNQANSDAFAYAERDLTLNSEYRKLSRGYRNYPKENYSGYEVFIQTEEGYLAERIYITSGSRAYIFTFPIAEEDPKLTDPVENNQKMHQMLETIEFSN